MMPCLRLCLFVALTFPLSAHAATYKCVVEGKTTYQQLPCDANAAQREIETGPRHAAPPVRSIPAAEAAPAPGAAPKGALDAAGREALARDAFAALKRRDFERFGTLLCARARQKYSRPDTKDTLPLAARGFAARGTELGAVLANEPRYVHFVQNERDAGQGAVVPVSSGKAFSVGLDRDADGRTCVDGFGTLARSTR